MLLNSESLKQELPTAIQAYASVVYDLRVKLAAAKQKEEEKAVAPSTISPPLSLCISTFLQTFKAPFAGNFIFPEFSKLCVLALIIPLSSVDCERGFSLMNIIKTDLRANMNNETLCALMRIALGTAEKDFPFELSAERWFDSPRTVSAGEIAWLDDLLDDD
jgi:hypothetical protein